MFILRIEHLVPNYDKWKIAFEQDPAGREKAGVLRYRIMRSTENPNFVLIDLEFETAKQAENLLANLKTLWQGVAGKIMVDPRAQIVEVVDSKQLYPV